MQILTSKADREIARLSTLHPKGFDLSLGRIARLLDRLGHPHRRLPPVIHIAGTNGKGSAAAFARALIEAAGLTTHVHTSPHLVNWHERYRLGAAGGGRLVEDDVLADAVKRVAEANAGDKITVFEILTAVTFLLFSEHPADAAILEVGLGGRFDATNMIERPAVSVIMPISLDHESYLGDRVELIAVEKAGIIKAGVPVVVGHQDSDTVREVIVSTAERLDAPCLIYGQDFLAMSEHGRMVYQDEDGLMDLPMPGLAGRHQLANAAAAVAAGKAGGGPRPMRGLAGRPQPPNPPAAIAAVKAAGFPISTGDVERAMTSVRWPGRLQRLGDGLMAALAPEGSELWIDGGHNPGAAAVIAETLAEQEDRHSRPLFLICGMLNTKDQVNYFRAFAGMARHVFAVPVKNTEAGVHNAELAARANEAGLSAEPIHSPADALKLLRATWDDAEPPPRILICGSLYLIGDVLAENGTPPQ